MINDNIFAIVLLHNTLVLIALIVEIFEVSSFDISFEILSFLKIALNINCITCVIQWMMFSRWFQLTLSFCCINLLKCKCKISLNDVLFVINVNKSNSSAYLIKSSFATLVIFHFVCLVNNDLKFNSNFWNCHWSSM